MIRLIADGLRVNAIAIVLLAWVAQPARATWFVNTFGQGACRLDYGNATIGFPGTPPNIAVSGLGALFGGNASVSIPGTIPLPAGSNPRSSASSTNGVFWGHTSTLAPLPADGFLDGSTELLPYIKPVSPQPVLTVTASGVQTSASTVSFTVNWFGSDSGTALRIRAFEYLGDLASTPPGFDGEVTSLPGWSTLSTQLFISNSGVNQGVLVGDGKSHTISFSVTDPTGDATKIFLVGDGGAEAIVPEPSSFTLLGISTFGLLGSVLRRHKPRTCGRGGRRLAPGESS